MKLFQTLFLFSIIVLLSFITATAQTPRELKIANTLSQSGEHETALEIYMRLYRSGIHTLPVINGIQKAYENLGQYEELIAFLEEVLQRQPANFNYRIDMGKAYYRIGETEKALEIWKEVYREKPPHLMRYRLVASAMVQVRLFDEAINVYQQAMQDLKNQETMYLDIGTLYRAQLNYEKAVSNYLLYYLHHKKKLNYVRSLILGMTKDDEATDRILAALTEFIEQKGSDPELRELQAGLYIKKKDFDSAYAIYSSLDKPQSNHQFLLRFADEAERNHAYEFAVKALEQVKNSLKEKIRLKPLELDLARNYYKLGVRDEMESYVKKALSLLAGIENTPTGKNAYYQSMELTGDIYRHYYQDYDRAIQAFSVILEKRSSGIISERIRLKLGRCHFMKNNLEQAAGYYGEVSRGGEKNLARYYLAQLHYFKGRFSRAEKQFQSLLGQINMTDSLANNILDYVFQISQHGQDSLLLAQFAEAERLQEQHKYSEAAKKYGTLVEAGNPLGLQAGIRSARLYIHLQELEQARDMLTDLLVYFEEEPQLDEVIFLLAGVCRDLDEKNLALDYYQQLLAGYPESFFLEEARDQARAITAQLNQEHTP